MPHCLVNHQATSHLVFVLVFTVLRMIIPTVPKSELSCTFPQISHIDLRDIITVRLTQLNFEQDGFRKCSRVHTKLRMDAVLPFTFLERYHEHGD
jgi:hypothetical protein